MGRDRGKEEERRKKGEGRRITVWIFADCKPGSF
jgi:hypothetical protein